MKKNRLVEITTYGHTVKVDVGALKRINSMLIEMMAMEIFNDGVVGDIDVLDEWLWAMGENEPPRHD